MGKIVIAKAGSTFPALATRRGDFEHWILAGMQVDEDQASVVDVAGGASLLGYDGVEGVVVTGSHAMVTEQRPWSERLAEWLAGAAERQIPIFGICFGHQLLAYALGGKVGDNPNSREFGTAGIQMHSHSTQHSTVETVWPDR